MGVVLLGHLGGFLMSLAWVFYPAQVMSIPLPLAGIPHCTFYMAGILAFALGLRKSKMRWYILSGCALAISALFWPSPLFLPLVLAIVLLFQPSLRLGKRLLQGACLLAAFFLAVLPWELKIYQETGKLAPLGTGGGSGVYDGLTYAVAKREMRAQLTPPPEDVVALMEEFKRRQDEFQDQHRQRRPVRRRDRVHQPVVGRSLGEP